MKHDCPHCVCEVAAERTARLKREQEQREREERERQFAARHSVLTDDDLRWARSMLPGNRQEQPLMDQCPALNPNWSAHDR